MSSDDIKDYIIITHGDLSAVNDSTWSRLFNAYISRKQTDIDKIYNSVNAEYNPLDNNDVITETVILNKSDKTESKTSETRVNEYNKSFDGGLENTAYSENENITPAEVNPHNTLSESFQNSDNTGYNNTSKTLERKHGNISSVTNQSIITQEIKLRMIDWLYNLIDKAVFYGGVYFDN